MKATRMVLVCMSILFLGVCQSAIAQNEQPQRLNLLKTLGMTEDEYMKAGLYKLSNPELLSLNNWISRALDLKLHCGPDPFGSNSLNTEPRKRVAIYLKFDEHAPSVIQSRVRQQIRAMSDIELVQMQQDADLSISLVLRPLEIQGEVEPEGYDVFIVSSVPCKSQVGPITDKGFALPEQSILKTQSILSASLPQADAATQIVAIIDTNMLESARKARENEVHIWESWKKLCAQLPDAESCKGVPHD